MVAQDMRRAARQVDPHVPVVLFDTGLLFPETVHYMEDLAQQWRLHATAQR